MDQITVIAQTGNNEIVQVTNNPVVYSVQAQASDQVN